MDTAMEKRELMSIRTALGVWFVAACLGWAAIFVLVVGGKELIDYISAL